MNELNNDFNQDEINTVDRLLTGNSGAENIRK